MRYWTNHFTTKSDMLRCSIASDTEGVDNPSVTARLMLKNLSRQSHRHRQESTKSVTSWVFLGSIGIHPAWRLHGQRQDPGPLWLLWPLFLSLSLLFCMPLPSNTPDACNVWYCTRSYFFPLSPQYSFVFLWAPLYSTHFWLHRPTYLRSSPLLPPFISITFDQ